MITYLRKNIKRMSLSVILCMSVCFVSSSMTHAQQFSITYLPLIHTERPTVTIWEVGDPRTPNDMPADLTLFPELVAAAKTHNANLEIVGIPAGDIADRFESASHAGTLPEFLVFSNYSVLSGRSYDIRGLYEIENIDPVYLVTVSNVMTVLNPGSSGWVRLIDRSTHFEKASAIALELAQCDPGFQANWNEYREADRLELEQVAIDIGEAYWYGNLSVLDSYTEGGYEGESFLSPPSINRATPVSICKVWGNENLAFVHISAGFDNYTALGQTGAMLGLKRSSSDGWKLFLTSYYTDLDTFYTPFIEEAYDALPSIPAPDVAETIVPPVLVSPSHWEDDYSFPTGGDLKWRHDGQGEIGFLIEIQVDFDQDDAVDAHSWGGSRFHFTLPDSGNTHTAPFPHVTGAQPHRWRVWTLGASGQAIPSDEWRTIDFYCCGFK